VCVDVANSVKPSFGVVLLELAASCFRGEHFIPFGRTDHVADVRDGIPKQLLAIVETCTTADAMLRPDSGTVRRMLESCVDDLARHRKIWNRCVAQHSREDDRGTEPRNPRLTSLQRNTRRRSQSVDSLLPEIGTS
jgi:hypothetical protein